MRKSAKIGGQGDNETVLVTCDYAGGEEGGQPLRSEGKSLVELPVGLKARRQLPGGEAGGALAPRLQP